MSPERAVDGGAIGRFNARLGPSARWGWWTPVVLAALLRLSLLVLVLHTSGIAGVWTFDTDGYVDPIRELMHGSFSTHGSVVTSDGPDIIRTPGYSIFLMFTGMANNHPVRCVVWQIGLACLAVFFVYKIGLLLFKSEAVAMLCAILYAIEPLSIFYSVQLFAEGLFTALFLGFLYALILYLQSPKWATVIWAAVILSASTYVKPASYYLAPICAIGLAIIPLKLRWGPRLVRAFIFMSICAVLIGAWQVRNYKETGYSGFCSLADTQLYYYNALGVVAKRTHTDFFALQAEQGLGNPRGFFNQHPEQARRQAIGILKENPWLYAQLHVQGMAVVLLDPCATDLLRHLGLYPKVGGLMSMVVNRGIPTTLFWLAKNRPLASVLTLLLGTMLLAFYVLGLVGISPVLEHRDMFVTLVSVFTYFVAITGGPAANGRYRYPIMPIIALFAGAGLARLLAACGKTRRSNERGAM